MVIWEIQQEKFTFLKDKTKRRGETMPNWDWSRRDSLHFKNTINFHSYTVSSKLSSVAAVGQIAMLSLPSSSEIALILVVKRDTTDVSHLPALPAVANQGLGVFSEVALTTDRDLTNKPKSLSGAPVLGSRSRNAIMQEWISTQSSSWTGTYLYGSQAIQTKPGQTESGSKKCNMSYSYQQKAQTLLICLKQQQEDCSTG